MSLLTRFMPRLFNTLSRGSQVGYVGGAIEPEVNAVAGGLFNVSVRNTIRIHFPRPSERKRILRHGWKKRLSTPAGRRIIMNRILKGRHVLSH